MTKSRRTVRPSIRSSGQARDGRRSTYFNVTTACSFQFCYRRVRAVRLYGYSLVSLLCLYCLTEIKLHDPPPLPPPSMRALLMLLPNLQAPPQYHGGVG